MGSEKVVTISERERKRPTTLKTMRSFIRLGRARPHNASADEERGLLEAGPSAEPERPSSQTSMSSEELLVDTRSPTDTPKLKKMYVMIFCIRLTAGSVTDRMLFYNLPLNKPLMLLIVVIW